MSILNLLLRKECPTCHRLMDRAELDRHVKRHAAGRASWENRKAALPTFTTRAIPDSTSDAAPLSTLTPA